MKRYDAVATIIQEARRERGSKTAAKRVLKACETLGLLPFETTAVMIKLEYARSDGTPYSADLKGLWEAFPVTSLSARLARS